MRAAFPFHLEPTGHIATTRDPDRHIVELIEQVLFTAPGERPNRPDFGCGLLLFAFQNGDSQVAGATGAMIQAALGRALGSLIRPLSVEGRMVGAELVVTVRYAVVRTGTTQESDFRRSF